MHNKLRNMAYTLKRVYSVTALMFFCMIICISLPVRATETTDTTGLSYTNDTTGYKAMVDDQAALLTTDEQARLLEDMKPITEYGNVAFNSVSSNLSTTDSYASNYYHYNFSKESGTLFFIDMDNRKIYIFSDGDIYRTINKSYANTITDNVYTYASKGDYYGCASKAFSQIYSVLEGGRIAQPMKYTSNILFAIVLALFINYIIVKGMSSMRKASPEELMGGIFVSQKFDDFNAKYEYETREYSPQSDGGSGGGGGGGGGGGSSGGGGGHSF